jgi:uncharacterized OB-fold protein
MRFDGDEVRLVGSRCAACGVITFPAQGSCPHCTGTDVVEHVLPERGALWTWTIQRFPPKSPPYVPVDPDAFAPFAVGYVELGGEVRVEGRLTDCDLEQLAIGMPMVLTTIESPLADGTIAYAFRPDEGDR